MKKIFVAAAILAMFAAVSCKNNEKKAEEQAPEAAATETVAPEATVSDQLKDAAEEKAVEVGTELINKAGDAVLNN